MRCLWKSISQPGSLRPPPPPSKELPPSSRHFIIAQAVQLRLQPEKSLFDTRLFFFFLHLQHQPRVSHREQPTFTFHISQPVWLGHLAHSVVVLCHCRLSHNSFCCPRAVTREHKDFTTQLNYLFKCASQLTLGQKHFAAKQSYSSCEIEFVGQSVW